MPIDAYDKNDRAEHDAQRPSMDLTTFDDQLPKTAVTSQKNLIKRQLYHAQQQQRISAMNLNAEKVNEEVPEESVEVDEDEKDVDIEHSNDPLRGRNLNIAGLGVSDHTPGNSMIIHDDKDINEMTKVISATGEEIAENHVILNQLMIDFNVIVRKFILYTSIIAALTFCALITGAATGFFQWKGYVVNSLVFVLLIIGICIGFRAEKHWSFTQRLNYISYYWLLCWIWIIIVFTISLIWLFVLPSKYTKYCRNNGCSTSAFAAFMVTIIAALTMIIWFIFVMFYIDCVSRLIIVCGRFYDLWSKQLGLLGFIHKSCYRFRSIFKNFTFCMGRNTGLRLDDFIHFGCCCRYCKRKNEILINDRRTSDVNMYSDWEPVETDAALEYRKDHKCCRGLKLNCCGGDKGIFHIS